MVTRHINESPFGWESLRDDFAFAAMTKPSRQKIKKLRARKGHFTSAAKEQIQVLSAARKGFRTVRVAKTLTEET